MIEWIIYNTFVPLSPVALVWAGGKLVPKKHKPLFELIKDGQLFFYCTTIVAIILKDIASSNSPINAGISGFFYLILIAFAVLFGVGIFNKDDVDSNAMGWTSLSCVVLTTALVLSIRITEGLPL